MSSQLPYRSRFAGGASGNFTDSTSYRAKNCVAQPGTNGADYYNSGSAGKRALVVNPANKFRQAPMPPAAEEHRHLMNVMLDTSPQVDVALPPEQRPTNPQTGSSSVVQFFLLDYAKTGVLALGSFSGDSFANLQNNLLAGLQNLKDKGATQLIVDISNNGGGYICVAHVRTFTSVFFPDARLMIAYSGSTASSPARSLRQSRKPASTPKPARVPLRSSSCKPSHRTRPSTRRSFCSTTLSRGTLLETIPRCPRATTGCSPR